MLAKIRKWLFFTLFGLRKQAVGTYYKRFLREDQIGIPQDTVRKLLIQVLFHCKQSVPYYNEVMREIGDSFYENPQDYLQQFPILTKDIIRSRFGDLKSNDLERRKWYLNTSGGSTGEPVEFIQDWEYASKSGAIKLLFSKLAGREIGEPEIRLWGSERDIIHGSEKWRARLMNKLSNTLLVNAFRMTPERMREFIAILNTKRPKQIVAYVDAIYELARFSKGEGLEISPQTAVMTSAGTLYPFMRETIEGVFQCKVFNRYGSREMGDIACERPGCDGLWVAPWGNYVEIVDREGNRVPDGTQGDILVTSLTNFAMPFIRYRIGDCGVLSPMQSGGRTIYGQVIREVLGRTVDMFKTRNGTLIHAGFFMVILYSKKWVRKYQVVQKNESRIVFRIVNSGVVPQQEELDEIALKTRIVMGDDCQVSFEFVDDIQASGSEKYRYGISEVKQ